MSDIVAVPAISGAPAAAPSAAAGKSREAQLSKVAQQFEAMFMSEMIHSTRPSTQGAGALSGGKSAENWQMFMDQALGQAAATGGPAGDKSLHHAIEKALHDADARANGGVIR